MKQEQRKRQRTRGGHGEDGDDDGKGNLNGINIDSTKEEPMTKIETGSVEGQVDVEPGLGDDSNAPQTNPPVNRANTRSQSSRSDLSTKRHIEPKSPIKKEDDTDDILEITESEAIDNTRSTRSRIKDEGKEDEEVSELEGKKARKGGHEIRVKRRVEEDTGDKEVSYLLLTSSSLFLVLWCWK